MSGGACEFIASFDGDSTSSNLTSYGGNMIEKDVGALNPKYDSENPIEGIKKYLSTKYITVYRNGTEDDFGRQKLFEVSKLGDAIKEVRKKSNRNYGWFGDYSHFVTSNSPFFGRGSCYNYQTKAGVFYANGSVGAASDNVGCRAVLSALAP